MEIGLSNKLQTTPHFGFLGAANLLEHTVHRVPYCSDHYYRDPIVGILIIGYLIIGILITGMIIIGILT